MCKAGAGGTELSCGLNAARCSATFKGENSCDYLLQAGVVILIQIVFLKCLILVHSCKVKAVYNNFMCYILPFSLQISVQGLFLLLFFMSIIIKLPYNCGFLYSL